MDDATREALLDKRIQARLAVDHAYRYAADPEEQARREDEIEREEEQLLNEQLASRGYLLLP